MMLLVFLTSACAASPTAPSQAGGGNLTNTQWELVSFSEQGVETPVVAGSTITLEFGEDGQAGGSGGCNSYGARYEVRDGSLSISEIVSTLMACVDEQVMEQERRYFEALGAAIRHEISGDSLTIWYGDGEGELNFITAASQ